MANSGYNTRKQMQQKKKRGRPIKNVMPDRIDAMPEQIAERCFQVWEMQEKNKGNK